MKSNSTDPVRDSIRLREIPYWIEWLASGFATGKWDSFFLGRGVDFQGIAPFRDDPDMVRINWQATVLSRELKVNQFRKERTIDLFLLGNLGASMAFGTNVTKQDRLALIAAAFAYSARRFKDSFHFVGYADKVEYGFPQIKDETYPFLLAQSIMEFDCLGKQRGGLVLASLAVPVRRSLVILVSDFLGPLGGVEQALSILAPRHEVIPLVLWDPREVTLPGNGLGLLPLCDLETGEQSYVFLTPHTRRRFEENSRQREKALEELFHRYGIEPHFLKIGDPDTDLEMLMKIFIQRNRD